MGCLSLKKLILEPLIRKKVSSSWSLISCHREDLFQESFADSTHLDSRRNREICFQYFFIKVSLVFCCMKYAYL